MGRGTLHPRVGGEMLRRLTKARPEGRPHPVLEIPFILFQEVVEPSAETYRSAAIASLPGPPVSLHFNLGGGQTFFRTYLGLRAGTDSRHKGSIDGRNDFT